MGEFAVVKPFTLIRCDGEVRIGNYTEISSFSLIYGSANFAVGYKCYIGPQSLINVTEDVVIGNVVGIGPRTMIFTHGSFLPYTEGYWVRFGKVTIGNGVWIAAGVFIHPGVEVGDNVFVNSRSVITQSISSGQVVEGYPAKEVYPMEKLRRSVTPAKRDKFIQNTLSHFVSFSKQVDKSIQITDDSDHVVSLRSKGKEFAIALVNSSGDVPPQLEENHYNRIIVLSNCEDWKPPFLNEKATIFDFTTMKTTYSKDKLCCEFYLFLKQYYGIIFEYE